MMISIISLRIRILVHGSMHWNVAFTNKNNMPIKTNLESPH